MKTIFNKQHKFVIMIAANELRIGNWFLCNLFSADEFYKVETIEAEGVKYFAEDGYVIPYAEIEPIVLSPEILEKCGFSQQYFFEGIKTGVYHKDGLKIGLDGDDFVNNQYTAVFGDTFVKVKHLHQLQNLYFALKGQELEVQLKVAN